MTSIQEAVVGTRSTAPTAQDTPPKKAQGSTYHVLVLAREDGVPLWRYLGPTEAANSDAARKIALGRENIETASAVAVPDRSWRPEVFTTQTQPRYVKGSALSRA